MAFDKSDPFLQTVRRSFSEHSGRELSETEAHKEAHKSLMLMLVREFPTEKLFEKHLDSLGAESLTAFFLVEKQRESLMSEYRNAKRTPR